MSVSTKDFEDGAAYEAGLRTSAREQSGHGQMLSFVESLAAKMPWLTDHEILSRALFVFDPALDELRFRDRSRRVLAGKSIYDEQGGGKHSR